MKNGISQNIIEMVKGCIMRLENEDKILKKYPSITWVDLQKIIISMTPATTETKSKLKLDPLLILFNKNRLSKDDLTAANFIRRAWMIQTAGLTIRVSSFEARVDKSGSPPVIETDKEIFIIQKYKRWCRDCDATINNKKPIRLEPIIELLTQPVSLKEIDKRFNYRNGTTAGMLIEALGLYHKQKDKLS